MIKKYISILSIIWLLIHQEAIAGHAMGGEITYTCAGGNQYLLTFTFYRDCIGIAVPSTMSIDITNSCGWNNPSLVLQSVLPHRQISPLCSSAISTCNGGILTGIEECIYQGLVTLPGACSDWTFSHTECCRSNGITTTLNPSSNEIFIFSTLNNLNGICNNSPTFTNRPDFIHCLGQQLCFNHGVFDVDGDSLSFELIIPRTGPNPADTVTFLPGYSYLQPFLSSPPATFNPVTGDFCITPTQSDLSLFAILVREFREGTLIGQVERDIRIMATNCSNNLPALTGIDGGPTFQAAVCANLQNCFHVNSVDTDLSDSTVIEYDFSVPNATITHGSTNRDEIEFCWTPTDSDATHSPYCFTLTVSDNSCPYIGRQVYTYCLSVDTNLTCVPLTVNNNIQKNSALKIYPQPANDHLFIETGDMNNSVRRFLRIESLYGHRIYQNEIKDKVISLDIRNWQASGFYIAYLVDSDGRILKSGKIILTAQ